ncbi:MAG: type VI secretion system contractile sheath large subunit [bacterium]
MAGNIEFEFTFSQTHPDRNSSRTEQTPTRFLVLGNFSGCRRGEAAAGPISQRTLHQLDIDTFASVLTHLKPRIHLDSFGDNNTNLEIEIEEMDDFHPDGLFRKLDLFRSLREMRKRLLDPDTFTQAAAELDPGRAEAGHGTDEEADADQDGDASPAPDQQAPREDSSDTLERLLGKKPAADAEPSPQQTISRGKAALTPLIRDLIAPYIIPEADPRQDVYVESVDAAIREQMRSVLHYPTFQAVESGWRGLDWLVSELEIGEELQLFACDLTKEELLADLRGTAGRLEDSEFYKLLIEKEIGTPGGRIWSFLLGDYSFGHSEDDVFLLAALGAIASRAGAPFLAGAKAEILGCQSLAENPDSSTWSVGDPADRERWASLRSSLQASWLGLALPRVLLRVPFGSRTDTIESFPFEELTGDPDHESFLWGNAAFACGLLLARDVLNQSGNQLLEGLPAYVNDRENVKTMQPCAEVLLSERVGLEILQQGLMPLLSHRDRNVVSIMRFQSLAEPPTPLEGR